MKMKSSHTLDLVGLWVPYLGTKQNQSSELVLLNKSRRPCWPTVTFTASSWTTATRSHPGAGDVC